MKITDEGYTLTDVPGQEYIQIVPAPIDGGEVSIVIKDQAHEAPRAWDLDVLQEYVEALGRAISLGYNMANNNSDRAS